MLPRTNAMWWGAAIEAPGSLRFSIVYGVSENAWRFWDLRSARDEIGFEPQDDAERWRSTDD